MYYGFQFWTKPYKEEGIPITMLYCDFVSIIIYKIYCTVCAGGSVWDKGQPFECRHVDAEYFSF